MTLMMLSQIRRMPPVISKFQIAMRNRAAGTGTAADETYALQNASNWDGEGGEASRDAMKRSVRTFDRSMGNNTDLAQNLDAIYERASGLVKKIDALRAEGEAYKYPFQLVEEENRFIVPETRNLDDETRHAVIDKHAELQSKLEEIRREGESIDRELGQVIATATGGNDPNSAGQQPPQMNGLYRVGGEPPDGRPNESGYWVIDKTKPLEGDVRPAGSLAPFTEKLPPDTPYTKGPSTGMLDQAKNWVVNDQAPASVYQRSFQFRVTGTEFNGQTKMVEVDGKQYQALWKNYTYEVNMEQNVHNNTGSSIIKDMYTPSNTWTPITFGGIAQLSAENPGAKFYVPDGCGNNLVVKDGAPSYYGPKNSHVGIPEMRSGR